MNIDRVFEITNDPNSPPEDIARAIGVGRVELARIQESFPSAGRAREDAELAFRAGTASDEDFSEATDKVEELAERYSALENALERLWERLLASLQAEKTARGAAIPAERQHLLAQRRELRAERARVIAHLAVLEEMDTGVDATRFPAVTPGFEFDVNGYRELFLDEVARLRDERGLSSPEFRSLEARMNDLRLEKKKLGKPITQEDVEAFIANFRPAPESAAEAG